MTEENHYKLVSKLKPARIIIPVANRSGGGVYGSF